MKNVVECPREFIAYFNALEPTCVRLKNTYLDADFVSLKSSKGLRTNLQFLKVTNLKQSRYYFSLDIY